MMTKSDFLSARVMMYDLLARLYTYPFDSAVLDAVLALRIENAPSALTDALAVMQAHLAATDNRAELVEALNIEATRLFEGPGQPVAPPYASFYLNGGHLMGQAALAVKRAYLAANALPRDDGRIPPDHLALALGFMAFLARAAISSNERDAASALTNSAAFLCEHLAWVRKFSIAVVNATSHPFFIGLANLTRAFLESDAEWLQDLLATEEQTPVMEVSP